MHAAVKQPFVFALNSQDVMHKYKRSLLSTSTEEPPPIPRAESRSQPEEPCEIVRVRHACFRRDLGNRTPRRLEQQARALDSPLCRPLVRTQPQLLFQGAG